MFRYVVLAGLFYVLSPGNFLTLPRGGSKRTVTLVHAAVFVVAYYLFEKVAEMLRVKVPEGFQMVPRRPPPSTQPTIKPWYNPIQPVSPGTVSPETVSPEEEGGWKETNDDEQEEQEWFKAERIYNNAIDDCYNVRFKKDIEYSTNGDNTDFFRELDRLQGAVCDNANIALDKVRMYMEVTPLDYNEYKTSRDYDSNRMAYDIDVANDRYTYYRNRCRAIQKQKDLEYKKNGDNTPRFRDLDRQQGKECDQANYAADKLKSLGGSVFSW